MKLVASLNRHGSIKSDSGYCDAIGDKFGDVIKPENYRLGPNDFDLMSRLRNAGTDHRKFMRMITVYLDITAPLYWWKARVDRRHTR